MGKQYSASNDVDKKPELPFLQLFGVVRMRPIDLTAGSTLYGPFGSRDDALHMPKSVDDQYIDSVFEFEDHRDYGDRGRELPQTPHDRGILITGDIVNGLSFHGPFDPELASEYGDVIFKGEEWAVAELYEPPQLDPTKTQWVEFGAVPIGASFVQHEKRYVKTGYASTTQLSAYDDSSFRQKDIVSVREDLFENAMLPTGLAENSDVFLSGSHLRIVVAGVDRAWLKNQLLALKNGESSYTGDCDVERRLLNRVFTSSGHFSFEVALGADYQKLGALTEATVVMFRPERDEITNELLSAKAVWWDETYQIKSMLDTLIENGYVDLLNGDMPGLSAEVKQAIARVNNKNGVKVNNKNDVLQWPDKLTFVQPILNAAPTSASPSVTLASPSVTAAGEEIYGEGKHVYNVLLTLDTTAHRYIRVRADSEDDAKDAAIDIGYEEQGAFFEMNEGNHTSVSDFSATHVEQFEADDSPAP